MFDEIDWLKIEVSDLQRLQQMFLEAAAALRPTGAAGRMIQAVTLHLHRHMLAITHVITGRLKNSLFVDINLSSLHGSIFTEVRYSIEEEARGGSHAFMHRTETEAGPEAESLALSILDLGVTNAFDQS